MVKCLCDLYFKNKLIKPLAEFFIRRLWSLSRPPILKMDIHFLPLRDPFLLSKETEVKCVVVDFEGQQLQWPQLVYEHVM